MLHQTSTAEDFAEPDLTLDYGEHTLKVIATRSTSPTLLDAGGADWTVSDNVLTAVGESLPAVLTSAKTSDTFGAVQDINFNSIKVRLEHPEAIDDMFNMNHFNSIKVRLELLE